LRERKAPKRKKYWVIFPRDGFAFPSDQSEPETSLVMRVTPSSSGFSEAIACCSTQQHSRLSLQETVTMPPVDLKIV
jgi:hypothetical protein